MYIFRKTLVCSASVAILFIFFIHTPQLPAVEVIQINQAKVRLRIPPGGAHTDSIKVDNPSPESKKVRVYAEDWVYLPACDGTKEFKPAGTTQTSAANWITFVPAEFEIPAYASQIINYTVKVPDQAKGGHYAALFFENFLSEQKAVTEGVSVNVAVRVASLFYVEPEGTITRQAKIDNLKVIKSDRYHLALDFSNTGNVDITAKANFFIMDQKGMVLARGEFTDAYTLPGNSTTMTATWKEPIPRGTYAFVLSVDIGKALEELNLGRGPVITKETKITIGASGEVVSLGELK